MIEDNTTPASQDEAAAADLRFVTRHVTDVETAAVTAVILSSLDEARGAEPAAEPTRNPWVQSGGALRNPISTSPGSWRRSVR